MVQSLLQHPLVDRVTRGGSFSRRPDPAPRLEQYRSATIRGRLTPVEDAGAALDLFSEVVLPGRTSEVRRPNRKELAATQVLSLPILDGGWLLKVADEWPATPEEADADPEVWSGLVQVRRVLDQPVASPWAASLPVPTSVRRLVDQDSGHQEIATP